MRSKALGAFFLATSINISAWACGGDTNFGGYGLFARMHLAYVVDEEQNEGTYSGYMVGDNRHGKGELAYRSGDHYDGTWKNNLRHGFGRLVYSNGDVYEGKWAEDKKHGQGTYTWKNGEKYIGGFKCGQRHGKATCKGPNGIITYKTKWKSGNLLSRGGYQPVELPDFYVM